MRLITFSILSISFNLYDYFGGTGMFFNEQLKFIFSILYLQKSALLNKYQEQTTLCKYIWEIKKEYNEMPTLKWSIVKSVLSYSNISKKYLLCLHEKLEIVNFEDQDHLLNKRSELISKCSYANKYLLRNQKAND